MKSVTINCVTVAIDGDRVFLSAPAGHSVSVGRADLFRALAELDGTPETPPGPAPESVGEADWVFLTVPALGHGRACRYRTGVARGGQRTWNPPELGRLAVEIRVYDVPLAHRDQTRFWKRGDPASVTIAGRPDIAEYAPDELGDDGVLSLDVGDRIFLLQIEVPA